MTQPLVTILIVSYNQGDYIRESIESAISQTYPNTEILLVDDGSTDHTLSVVRSMEEQGMNFKKILIEKSIGYCKAFNRGFSMSKGQYLIDLAADDLLLPERVAAGVASLLTSNAGVDFCDAYYIDEKSKIQGTHYQRDARGRITEPVKDGDVFTEVLRRYYICTPSMFIDRKVLNRLSGYDQSLYYEDFDFWVRSSRYFNYHFTDKILVKKRVHKHSMSKSQYLPSSKMLPTTLRVCQKAYELCRNPEEFRALAVRLRYEIRQAVICGNNRVANDLNEILAAINHDSIEARLWGWLISLNIDLSFLTKFIGKAR
ncbi:MAG: UDP-hexose transferase [Cyclobacteriaceae bacterium]|nr:MAG: UDP-hexose transferase [Cyclobacteriaceae bacterium]